MSLNITLYRTLTGNSVLTFDSYSFKNISYLNFLMMQDMHGQLTTHVGFQSGPAKKFLKFEFSY